MVARWVLTISLLLFFADSNSAQKISESFCKKIDLAIIQPLKPTNFHRSDVYSDECDFAFVVENTTDVDLDIEKFKSEKASIKDFLSSRSMYCFGEDAEVDESCDKSGPMNGWDDWFVSRSNTDNLLMLRKGKYIITMFSFNYDILTQMELSLRASRFYKW